MEIIIKGNKTEVTQMINNISNNAKDIKELANTTLTIDEVLCKIDSLIVNSITMEYCVTLKSI